MATTPKRLLGLSPGEDDFCRSETKHDRRMAQIIKMFVLARRLQKLSSQTRKLSWVRVSVKMLGLGVMMVMMMTIIIRIILYVIQRYMSNGQACDKLLGNKDW
jgi:hypothetical protein